MGNLITYRIFDLFCLLTTAIILLCLPSEGKVDAEKRFDEIANHWFLGRPRLGRKSGVVLQA